MATPAYLAAKRHKVPIVVHEANPLAGIANRLGAHLTTHVFTGHPDTKLRNGRYLGLPIRRQIAELDRFALGDKARAHFGLRPDLPVLLVTGGSQGAVSLNRALAGAVGAITSAGVQVLHVTGPKHVNEIQAPPGPVPYVAVPYVDRMDLAYAAADFALCRGGAMTCAELTAVGLPAAYVPLPHGNGEQRLNALPIVQRGGGLLVDDAELTADWIKTSLLPVLTNIDQVAGMSEAAAAMGRKDADRWLAKAVIDIVAAEAAARVAAGGQDPAGGSQPTPRPAPASAPAPSSAPAGQWASPAPQPPAPAPEEPGSLFTPRTTRHQQGAGGAQQPGPGGPQQPGFGSRGPQAAGHPAAPSSRRAASARPGTARARAGRRPTPGRQPTLAGSRPRAQPQPQPRSHRGPLSRRRPCRPGPAPAESARVGRVAPEPESGPGTSPAGAVIAAGRGHARWRW